MNNTKTIIAVVVSAVLGAVAAVFGLPIECKQTGPAPTQQVNQ